MKKPVESGFGTALEYERKQRAYEDAALRDLELGSSRSAYHESEAFEDYVGQVTGISAFVENHRVEFIIVLVVLFFVGYSAHGKHKFSDERGAQRFSHVRQAR